VGRPSNTEQRRAEIVDALRRVMAERGYEKATVAEVARAADLTAGLLHYHFQSKQQILLALVDHIAGKLEARFEQRAAGARGPRARLDAFIDAHVARGEDEDPEAVRCLVAIGAEALRQREVREAYERYVAARLDQATGLVRDVLRDEGRSTRRARFLAAAVLAAIEGAFQLGTATSGILPRGFAAQGLSRMVDGLIAAEPAA